MAHEIVVDVSDRPDLLRLAEEVRTSNLPRILRHEGEDLAVLMPLRSRRPKRARTAADQEAFRAAAGGWKNVDTDAFLQDNRASRDLSTRPPVEL